METEMSKSESGYSQLPWTASKARKSSNFGNWKAMISSAPATDGGWIETAAFAHGGTGDTRERAEANAELIAKRVNAYPALVGALMAIQPGECYRCGGNALPYGDCDCRACNNARIIRAALATH